MKTELNVVLVIGQEDIRAGTQHCPVDYTVFWLHFCRAGGGGVMSSISYTVYDEIKNYKFWGLIELTSHILHS